MQTDFFSIFFLNLRKDEELYVMILITVSANDVRTLLVQFHIYRYIFYNFYSIQMLFFLVCMKSLDSKRKENKNKKVLSIL